jgi:hypothetical protein
MTRLRRRPLRGHQARCHPVNVRGLRMSRKLVLASGAFAIAMTVAGIAFGSVDDYAFEPVKVEIKASNVATLAAANEIARHEPLSLGHVARSLRK